MVRKCPIMKIQTILNLDIICKNPLIDGFSSVGHKGPSFKVGFLQKVRKCAAMIQMEV